MPQNDLPLETAPLELRRRQESGERIELIDVREPAEFQLTRIEGASLIPMNDVPAYLQEIEARAEQATLVFLCHHGIRSLNVVGWLRKQGVASCQSLSGGIDRWSLEVDPSVPRY